jgi:hypothetical protein
MAVSFLATSLMAAAMNLKPRFSIRRNKVATRCPAGES